MRFGARRTAGPHVNHGGGNVLAVLSRRLTTPVGLFVSCVLVAFGLSAVSRPAAAGAALPANVADLTGNPVPGNAGAARLPGLPTATRQANPLALASNPVDYSYDAAGQLRGVSQTGSGGATGRYNYDPAGNVTSIDRHAPPTLSIRSPVPRPPPVGGSVGLSGTAVPTPAPGGPGRVH